MRTLASFLFTFAFAACAFAGDKLYVQDSGKIMLIDVDAKTLSLVASPRVDGDITDIATDTNGELYILTFTSLYRFDNTAKIAVLLGAHGIAGANALSFDGSGALYAASNADLKLYKLDVTTGAGTAFGSVPEKSAGDLAFIKGRLFFSSVKDTLGVINLRTGQTPSTVGNFGLATAVFGLAAGESNTLYGASYTKLFKVEPSTGAISFVMDFSSFGLGQAYGLASLKATPNRDEDRLFNFAEDTFPTLLSPPFSASLQSGPYYYRFFRNTGAILAVHNGQLVYSLVGSAPTVLGPVSSFLPEAINAGY